MTKEALAQPQFVNLNIEDVGSNSPEIILQTKLAFSKAAASLEKEWGLAEPVNVGVQLHNNKTFREGVISGPSTWKYCFLIRDHSNNCVLFNPQVFAVLPEDAEKMIKHEIGHIVVSQLVGNPNAYRRSYFLEEGTAGLDGATERLKRKIQSLRITDIPDPLGLQTMEDIMELGGDTNKEPFIDQLGYLAIFSATEYLRNKYGEQKILDLYRKLGETNYLTQQPFTLEEAFSFVCSDSLRSVVDEWMDKLKK